jgi:hypothetical protein
MYESVSRLVGFKEDCAIDVRGTDTKVLLSPCDRLNTSSLGPVFMQSLHPY